MQGGQLYWAFLFSKGSLGSAWSTSKLKTRVKFSTLEVAVCITSTHAAYWVKWSNVKLKTWTKQLLGSLLLDIALSGLGIAGWSFTVSQSITGQGYTYFMSVTCECNKLKTKRCHFWWQVAAWVPHVLQLLFSGGQRCNLNLNVHFFNTSVNATSVVA